MNEKNTQPGRLWTHVASGNLYTLLGIVRVQAEFPISDLTTVTVYKGGDGDLWLRPTEEFLERFSPLMSPEFAADPTVELMSLIDGYAKEKADGEHEESYASDATIQVTRDAVEVALKKTLYAAASGKLFNEVK